jgi:hypothetical protein
MGLADSTQPSKAGGSNGAGGSVMVVTLPDLAGDCATENAVPASENNTAAKIRRGKNLQCIRMADSIGKSNTGETAMQ